jgi:hypothetical protein
MGFIERTKKGFPGAEMDAVNREDLEKRQVTTGWEYGGSS